MKVLTVVGTNGQTKERTNGHTKERTNGQTDKRTNGQIDRWRNGQISLQTSLLTRADIFWASIESDSGLRNHRKLNAKESYRDTYYLLNISQFYKQFEHLILVFKTIQHNNCIMYLYCLNCTLSFKSIVLIKKLVVTIRDTTYSVIEVISN